MQAADLTILLLMQLDSINSWILYMVFIHDNSTENIWLWLSQLDFSHCDQFGFASYLVPEQLNWLNYYDNIMH